jgi:Zn-dependent protease with chaperone function
MKRSTAFAIALLLGTTAVPAFSAGPPARRWPLSAAARDWLDRVAYRQELENLPQEKVNLVGQVPAWVLTRLKLAPEEERRLSQAAHEARLRRDKTSPVDRDVQRSFDGLIRALPAHQNPPAFRWTLTAFDVSRLDASTPGAGYVHISASLVRALRADPARGKAALAFLLAREVAHVSLGHCRAGWQRQLLEEQARNGIASKAEASRWSALLQTQVERVGQLVSFLYSRNQEYEADLFALHLCRNAGLDIDEAIDGLRFFAALRHPEALGRADFRPPPRKLRPNLAYYCSRAADPLLRLERLLMERDGRVEPEAEFGLFFYERDSDSLRRLAAGDLKAGDHPIVFVHGLHGGLGAWDEFLDAFGQRRELLSRPLLVFCYPSTGSIARSGKFLFNQVRELVPSQITLAFVCYSAGGLVFRTYAERLDGPFDRAVFIATPHAGSDLTQLAFLVDLLDFAGLLKNGLPAAVAETVANGRGEMKLDLHPDSLFLRYLGQGLRRAARYRILYGEALNRAEAIALQVAFLSAVRLANKRWVPGLPEGILREQGTRLFSRLTLPAEILRGDGVVRSQSAILPGVPGPIRLRRNHLALRRAPEVIRHVLEMLHH